MWFKLQIYEKYLKPKNDLTRPARQFNQELWAIKVFSKVRKFKNDYPVGKRLENSFTKKGVSVPWKGS